MRVDRVGVRVEVSRDVVMGGGSDRPWVLRAGTKATTARLHYGFGLILDEEIPKVGRYVYAEPKNLRAVN